MLPVAAFGQTKLEYASVADSLTDNQTEKLITRGEFMFLVDIDSMINEGQYLHALELMDVVEKNYPRLLGRYPSQLFYSDKVKILHSLEEWQQVVEAVDRYKEIYKGEFIDNIAATMFDSQGMAYWKMKKYWKAIASFEEGVSYYIKTGDIASQGNLYCSIGMCYMELEKSAISFKFYNKGISKFLDYFDTTPSALVKHDIRVKGTVRQTALDLFSAHLGLLAGYEMVYGTRQDVHDHLLMASHCGNDAAKKEYKRIFGYFYE